jgi:protein-L-isoaspartate(D-aspartate) O-methyltransferase
MSFACARHVRQRQERYNICTVLASEAKLAARRRDMVERQLRARGIRHEAVLDAFLSTPRELFVGPDQVKHAYEDHPLPIGFGQTISQPYIVAFMCEKLDPRSRHRVLDIGAGSGYQTAVLARLTRHVYGVERIEALTERAMAALGRLNVTNATLRTGDGSIGWPTEAPFDRIICGAASPDVPAPWIDQLADGGKIILPVGGAVYQTLVLVEKRGREVRQRKLCDVRFVKLVGQEAWSSE